MGLNVFPKSESGSEQDLIALAKKDSGRASRSLSLSEGTSGEDDVIGS